MDGPARDKCSRGFTLAELLTVVGLVAMLVALFLPVFGRIRAAAGAASCLSNLRQIGTAWTMSLSETHGRFFDYAWYTPTTPDVAWNGYWTGALDRNRVGPETLLCPAARDPSESDVGHGYGNATFAWTGRFEANGTAIRLNDKTYRVGSYGYNRWLTAGGGVGVGGRASGLADVSDPSSVPVFMDCAYADARPLNGTPASPVQPPPDLSGAAVAPGKPEHWKFILARHGRGINVYRADGSAQWVRLDELYLLSWQSEWVRYRLPLPRE